MTSDIQSATAEVVLVVKFLLLLVADCSPFFRCTGSARMHFDASAAQCKNFNSFFVNDLRLEFFFDEIEDSDSNPVSESPINSGPFTKFFGQCSPKGKMVDHDVAALLRKQMFDTFVLCVWIAHDGR